MRVTEKWKLNLKRNLGTNCKYLFIRLCVLPFSMEKNQVDENCLHSASFHLGNIPGTRRRRTRVEKRVRAAHYARDTSRSSEGKRGEVDVFCEGKPPSCESASGDRCTFGTLK
ncbi:hypothetical protein PUN28_013452 [Cardiocondyla obscurior]|uniref:Uncharacterized protein n=1 Tax=Cardiocondyla obscurior TaxID=286306 RepID=A0AAW2F2L5_9HYME